MQCYVTGDEFYHRVHDMLDYTILRHPGTGYFIYAIREGESLIPSEYIVGIDNPAEKGLTPGLKEAEKALEKAMNMTNIFPEQERLWSIGL